MKTSPITAFFLVAALTPAPVLAQEAEQAQRHNGQVNWREIKVGRIHLDRRRVREVADELAQRTKVPIHVIQPRGELASLDLPADATLGDAIAALTAAAPGLRASPTERGVLLEFPLPDDALLPVTTSVENIQLSGSLADFLDRFVVPRGGWNYFPPMNAERMQIKYAFVGAIEVRELLWRVAEANGFQFCCSITLAPEQWTITTLTSDFSQIASSRLGRATRSIGISTSRVVR